MMVPKKSFLIAGAALLCLSTASSAQQGKTSKLRRVSEPLIPAQLDLSTGTVTRGKNITQKGPPNTIATQVTWASGSGILSGFVGVDTGPGGAAPQCEWIVRGVKGGGQSGLMSSFTFLYCSSAVDTLSAGPGGAARIGFRTNYSLGGGAPTGTTLGCFNLSGLPANTACSSIFGGFNCYNLLVGVGKQALILPDGAIGYSWRFSDLGTDGVLAKTFPWLTCVQSCTTNGMWPTAGGAGPDQNGQTNQVDQYCPPGTLKSSFSFASVPNGLYFTNVSMNIREYVPHASAGSTFGPGNNQTLVETAPAVWNGSSKPATFPYSVSLNCAGNGNSVALTRLAFTPGPPILGKKWGNIYVNLGGPGMIIGPFPHTGNVLPMGAPGGLTPSVTVTGACWFTQGFCGNSAGVGQLSNALTQTLGTF